MKTKESTTSLTIFNGPEAENGKRHVIACGYNDEGKFGYFICKELATSKQFLYEEIEAFYPRESEKTYQQVLLTFKNQFSAD